MGRQLQRAYWAGCVLGFSRTTQPLGGSRVKPSAEKFGSDLLHLLIGEAATEPVPAHELIGQRDGHCEGAPKRLNGAKGVCGADRRASARQDLNNLPPGGGFPNFVDAIVTSQAHLGLLKTGYAFV